MYIAPSEFHSYLEDIANYGSFNDSVETLYKGAVGVLFISTICKIVLRNKIY